MTARAIKKSRHMRIVYDQPGGLFYWVALPEKVSGFTLYEEMKACLLYTSNCFPVPDLRQFL